MKLAPVHRALAGRVAQIVIHTGQHYDPNMSSVFFTELEIPDPDYHLGVGSGTHGEQTGKMIQALDPILMAVKPEQVVVYGDTNSTVAGALAAVKLHLPTAHIEAGLRSFNRVMPEEINRILADHISDLLFAPTRTAVENLKREGIDGHNVHLVGDVMFDAALYYGRKAEQQSRILESLGLERSDYLLATIHRAENTDSPDVLRSIVEALAVLANEIPVVLPLHPRTRSALERHSISPQNPGRLRLIDPVGYLDMVLLEENARLVVTDSGGVQKEAFFYRVPCVTLRSETEWTELLELGWNTLVPPVSAEAIRSGVQEALTRGSGREGAPYGTGDTSGVIAGLLLAAHNDSKPDRSAS
jgi:UDP-GlcNAc3NAcA epimerase